MNRYPGIRPFRQDERHLFFGRHADAERLLRLVRNEQLVVLYGKSGYGKSSLLNAGLYPRLSEEGRYQHWEVRFGPYKPGESVPPASAVCLPIGPPYGAKSAVFPEEIFGKNLWQVLKSQQASGGNHRFIIFFDQFEELFTYPPEQVLEFRRQLAEALYNATPEAALRAFEQSKNPPDGAETLLYTPFELKVVFSIRADRMSLLKQLEDYLPNLLRHSFLLEALDEKQATEAVLLPAALDSTPGERPGVGSFSTPPFSYTPATLDAIFLALRDESGRVETSALQIVCKHVEDNIVAERTADLTTFQKLSNLEPDTSHQPITITPGDLGDLNAVFRAFYDNTIAALPAGERPGARRLVEDILIKDGIRLPFAEQALLAVPGIAAGLLEKLERASLLRVELDEQRRKIYEVGHDTLVGPIEEAAKARREAEARELGNERLRAEAERQKAEKRKIEVARRRNILLGAGALALLLFAVWKNYEAGKAKEKAEQAGVQVVYFILDNARQQITALDYEKADTTLQSAAGLVDGHSSDSPLGALRPLVAQALAEPAYFYQETGQTGRADRIALDIARLLEAPKDLTTFQKLSNLPALGSTLKMLREKSYGVFAEVPGGRFELFDYDSTSHSTAVLSPFRLATTEITWWQYHLFCRASGYPLPEKPGWGSDADNPVVNVSWCDAVLYCNWRSVRAGREPAYAIDSVGRSQGSSWEVTLLDGKNGYRLPTEAEWQYAATNAGRDAFEFAGDSLLQNVGWYDGNSGSRSRPVATQKPNGLGLYDMSGNAWEWCWDRYGDYPESEQTDYRGPASGSSRVLRGGAWSSSKYYCSVRKRNYGDIWYRNRNLGFRLAQGK